MASTGEAQRDALRAGPLGPAFEAHPNALNLLRLCLALEVLLWHSYALNDMGWLPERCERVVADIAVDCFFAISGFLIIRAWSRDPHPVRYLVARCTRILPGLWICLLVTAFLIARSVSPVPASESWTYVFANFDTWGVQYGIDGSPEGVPIPGVWNGSLWSLGYETGCYLAVLGLGTLGLLGRRIVTGWAFLCWIFGVSFIVAGLPFFGTVGLATRCALMFSAGGLLFSWQDRIVVSPRLLGAALSALLLGVLVLPDYRILAPLVAYACIAAALLLGRYPKLVLRNDLSFGAYIYGFPVQQLLLANGVHLGWPEFSLLSVTAVLPVAAFSWFLVERPALLAGRSFRRSRVLYRTPEVRVRGGWSHR